MNECWNDWLKWMTIQHYNAGWLADADVTPYIIMMISYLNLSLMLYCHIESNHTNMSITIYIIYYFFWNSYRSLAVAGVGLHSRRSSMGDQKEWSGRHTILFSIMVALWILTDPAMIIHECTRTFDFQIFHKLLPNFKLEHMLLDPTTFGMPVRRSGG